MKKGTLNIEYRPVRNDLKVELELVDGTVWLSKCEIADNFNVFISTVSTNLRVIEKNDNEFLSINTRQIKYKKGGEVLYTTLYNLDIIMELAFRMKSGYCRLFRKWVRDKIKDSFSTKATQTIFIDIDKKSNTPLN